MKDLIKILSILGIKDVKEEDIHVFKAEEDGRDYDVWRINNYVLKKTKEAEIGVFLTFFCDKKSYVPNFLGYTKYDDSFYFLSEYCPGETLSKCNRNKLIKALDSLIVMQDEYWEKEEYYDKALTMDVALKSINYRYEHLESKDLEEAYKEFINIYKKTPRTLCHDDLLPFNVLVGERAVLIDWEYGGMLPYLTSFARLIAHTKDDKDYLFYMDKKDYEFAIEYYFDNLVKKHGISYEEYLKSLNYFLFNEYCEWIMIANTSSFRDERYDYYLKLANAQATILNK